MNNQVCHQRVMRDRLSVDDMDGLFGAWWNELDVDIKSAVCRITSHAQARRVIEQYEWLGTYANAPIFAYGIYFSGHLGGVVVYGSPSPPNIARSVGGDEHANRAIQLARGACAHWAHHHSASKLISASLKHAEFLGYRYVFAYSDPEAGEVGTVYQATNWLHCGLTEARPDYFDASGARKTGHFQVAGLTKGARRLKHRYVYILGNKAERRFYRKALRWPVSEYPKRGLSTGRPCPAGESEVQPLEAAPPDAPAPRAR